MQTETTQVSNVIPKTTLLHAPQNRVWRAIIDPEDSDRGSV